jgi:hypothetical protein
MDISSVLKILILIKLMSLSMLDVDAAFRKYFYSIEAILTFNNNRL